MGVFRQFGALLWKNYLLRKRKPFFLLLEVLWPVIIFVAIALVRRGVPPSPKSSCHYQERALPSSGLLPFLQSAACTLENSCLNPDSIEARTAEQERLRSMLYKVEPYIRKNTTLTAFEALPTIAKVFNTLKEKLNDTVIEELDDRLVLRNLLRNHDKIVELLVDEYGLMSEEQARDLLDASLNPFELIKTLTNIDFREVACDKTKLSKYIFFRKNTDIEAVSRSLCDIDDDLISNITNEVVRQIDIANLIRFAEEFSNFIGEFDYAVLLGDLADLAEVYLDQSGLLDAIRDLPNLDFIPAALDKMAVIIPMFEDMKSIDMESISALYELFDPLMETVVSDPITLDTIRSIVTSLEEYSIPFEESEIDWKQTIKVTASITEALNSVGNNSMEDVMKILTSADLSSIYDLIEAMFPDNSNMSTAESLALMLTKVTESSAASLEHLMRSMFSNTTMNMMMTVSYEITEMLMDMVETYEDMDEKYRNFVTEDFSGTTVMNVFIQMGPEKMDAFMSEILDMANYEQMLAGNIDIKSMCVNITNMVYENDEQMANDIISSLCSEEIMSSFSELMTNSGYNEMVERMEGSWNYISSVIEDPESKAIFIDTKTLTDKVTKMINETTVFSMESGEKWSNIFQNLPYDQYRPKNETWTYSTLSPAAYMTNVMLSVKVVGETMEDTSVWNYMMPYVIGSEAYMAATAQPYRIMQEMMDVTTPTGMMVENMEYMPDIVPAMLNLMNREDTKEDMDAFYQDPMKAICDNDFLLLLNVSDKVPMDEIQEMICDIDWVQYFEKIIETMDWMGVIQKKMDIKNYNGTVPKVDWDLMMENMEMYMTATTMPDKIWKDMEYVMNKMNVTRLLENLGKMDNSIQDFSFNDTKSSMDFVVSTLDNLDRGMGDIPFWNYGKHVAKAWMAYTYIANDLFEHMKDSVDLTKYMNTISPTLGEYYMNISTMFPDLFDELTRNLQNPQMILSAVFDTKWDDICKGTKITDVLQLKESEGIMEFERGLCELNWTAIMEEVTAYNPNIKIYNDELVILAGSIDKAPRISINWTEFAEVTLAYFENAQTLLMSNNVTGIEGLDTNSLNTTLGDFVKTLASVDQWDMSRYGAIVDEMMKLWNSQGDTGGNTTFWDTMMQSSLLQAYIQYHFLVFGNHQLHYINTTNPIDIKKYFNSEEVNKLIRVTEVSSHVNAALLSNLKDYTRSPQKMTELFSSDLGSMCQDGQLFSKLFTVPADSNLTVQDLKDTVCGVNLNITKLVEELELSVPGFKDFLKAMSKVEEMATVRMDINVNYTQLLAENDRFTKLLSDIISNPPEITIFWSDPEEDMKLLLEQLEDFANFTMSGFGDQQITSTFGTIQQHVGEALSGLASSSPEISKIMYIADAYLRMIEISVIRDQTALWEDPSVSLAQYPEMLKIWYLMEKIPEVYETFQYTLTYSNQKISIFVSKVSEGFDKLCDADPATLMTVPPSSNFSFSQFMRDLCDIDFTALEAESNEYYGGQIIIDAYANVNNITEPTNITEMFQRLDKLYGTIVDMTDRNLTEDTLPRFLNMKIWEDIFSKSAEVLENSTLASADDTTIINQIMDLIDQLQVSVPDIRPFINTIDIYLAVTLQSAEQQLRILQDPASLFLEYPEMHKMWLLLDYLPELYLTFDYTAKTNPNKINNFTMNLDFENLCDANPSDLMTVPPGLSFDFADFHQRFCDVNLTSLVNEVSVFSGEENITQALLSFNRLRDLVDINAMGKRIDDLIKTYTEISNFTALGSNGLPRFLNETLWVTVADAMIKWSSDPAIYSQMIANSNQLLATLTNLGMSDEVKSMMRTAEVVHMMVENLLDKMDAKHGTNKTYTMEDFFTLSTEILNLIKLVQKPGMMEILLYLPNNPEVTTILMNPNTTEAILILCEKNWTEFLKLPKKAGVDYSALQDEFCAVNFTAIMPELLEEFSLQKIVDKLSSNDTVSWEFITRQSERLSERINDWATSPPKFEIPAHWTNETMWIDLLTKYSESMNSQSQITESLQQSIDQLGPLLNMSGVREFGLFIENLLTSMSDSIAKADTNYTLADFVKNVPALQELFKAIELGPEVLDSLLNATITKPKAFVEALFSGKIADNFCNETYVSDLMAWPSVVNVSIIVDSFCSLRNATENNQLIMDAGFSNFILGLTNKSVNPNWLDIVSKSEKLYTSFMDFVNKSSSFDVLKMTETLYYVENSDELWKLLHVFEAYSNLNNDSSLGDSNELKFMQSAIDATSIMMKVFDKFLKNVAANGNEFSLRSLFHNSTRALELLNTVDGLNTETVNGLLSARLKPGMELEFAGAIMNMTRLQEMFCDPTILRTYITLPDTPEMTDVIDAMCRALDENFLQEMQELFSIDELIKTITDATDRKKTDMQDFASLVQRVIEKTINLTSNATVEVPFQNLLDMLSGPEVQDTLMKVLQDLEKEYSNLLPHTDLLNELMEPLLDNSTSTIEIIAFLQTWNIWARQISNKIDSLSGSSNSSDVIIFGEALLRLLKGAVNDSAITDEIVNMGILNYEKLLSVLTSDNATERLCGPEFMMIFNVSSSSVTQETICRDNNRMVMTEMILLAAMFEYQYNKQIDIVRDEILQGKYNLSSSDISVATNNFINKLLKYLTDQANNTHGYSDFYDQLMDTMTDLQSTLNDQYANILKDWSPYMEQILKPFMTKEMERIGAAIEVVMDVFIDRLQGYSGEITKDYLLNNNTELKVILDALNALSHSGTEDLLDGSIDLSKLMSLVVEPETKLKEACDDKTFISLITKNGSGSDTARNIEKVMCMDVEAVAQALMNLSEFPAVQDKIMRILNGSEDATLDWSAMGFKAETLIKMITDNFMKTPTVDGELSEFFNIENMLAMLQSLVMNPNIIGQMTTAFMPAVDQSMIDIMDPVIGGLADLLKTFQEKKITIQSLMSDPAMLNELLSSLNSFESQLSTYTRNFIKPAIEHASTLPEVQTAVCDYSLLKETAKTVAHMDVDIFEVVSTLCGQDGSLWFDRLMAANFTQTELIGIKNLLESFYTSDKGGGSWTNLVNSMSDLVQGYIEFFNVSYSSMVGSETAPKLDENSIISGTMNSLISYLKIMESELNLGDSLQGVKQFFSTMINVQKFLNEQLEKGKDDSGINFEKLLPDAESLAKMITGLQGEETSAVVTLMNINPEAFLNISLHGKWEEVVCDIGKFYTEFEFSAGYDSEGVRTTLCEAVRSDSSAFNLILDYVSMSELLQEITDWMNSNSTTTVGSDVWSELWKHSEQFFSNILELQNIDLEKLTSYGESLLKHMGGVDTASTDSYSATCESTIKQLSGMSFYTDTLLPILNMVNQQTRLQYLYNQLAIDMMDAMCMEPASNFTRLVDLLKMADIPETMKNIADVMTKEPAFSCDSMIDASMSYAETLNKSFAMWSDMEKHGRCIEGQMEVLLGIFGDVTKLFEASKVMLREVTNEDFRDVIKTIAGNDEILKIAEYILQGFVQQQNWIKEANEKIQKNMTKLEDYIEDTFSLSPSVIQSLINATFSKDLANFTAKELVDSLCTDSLSEPADEFLSFFNSSLRNVVGIDCDKDWNTTYDVVNSLLTLSRLATQLQSNIALDSVEWWMGLSQDLAELATGIQGLSDLAGVLNNLNDIDVTTITENGELLMTIQRLLVDSGPDSLIDSLNKVLDKFGELNEDSQVVLEDIQIMTRGLLSFTTLRKLIISNVRIKDLLKDPDDFRRYLTEDMDMNSKVADAIVDGTLSFELLINASQANITDWVCEPAKLKDILNSKDGSPLDYAFVSETFCSLNTSTIANILEEVFNQLDIGDLVEEFITTNIDDILAESGVSMNETQAALEALQDANNDLKEAIEVFDEYAANLTDVISALAEAQIGTESPSTLSSLLCGTDVGDIEDEFSLGGSLPTIESFTEEQKKELEELKAENSVCEQLYLDIMSVGGGPIIWGYLKPLMRGKILFTPNNDITRGIIGKINTTFAKIEEFQQEVQQLASGASSLENITSGDTDMESLLDSPIVAGFLSQFSDSSETGFEDLVYTLNDTDSDLVKALSNAAGFMGDYIHCIELDRFVGYDTEADLEWEGARLARTNNLMAGIVFTNAESTSGRKKRQTGSSIPNHLMYKIRMDIDNVQHTQRIKERFWRPKARDAFADEMRYLRGFIQLQDMIDTAVIESVTGSTGDYTASTKQFPFPCHKKDTFLNALVAYLLPIMVTFAWLAGLALATYNLVLDREDGQEETLRAMGLTCCLNWWAWFLFTMLGMAVVSIIVTIISHYAELLPWTNFAIVFLYFLDFCFSTTMLCYFVSSFFTRTSIAILVTMIVYFLSYIPYIVLLTLDIQMTRWQKSLACLSSTSAFGFAAQYLAWYEEQQIGIHWDNIGESVISGDEASFSWCCIMMVIDGVIYLVLGWYVRNVKPGKYGVSEPWYFPVCPWYWASCFGMSSDSKDKYQAAEQGEHFEEETSMSPKIISVRGLSKEYKKGKPVVSDLSMDVHAGQVTTLLGHNGAAKTTTMNMLTGILEPTSGDVTIFNQPLRNMKESIGICPQHNALYKYMSVKEHMEFVQSVKNDSSGMSPKEEIRQILEEVNLWHCRHCSIQELSGGMQRRLCVALAFVGGSKAVILDEPTSGVDPSGRRSIWNLIIRKKAGTNNKAIGVLLSTHHLDEAEVISDKVCILHEGKLLCSGSPLYLKEQFSSGHRITVEREAASGDHEPTAITSCIQHFVPSAVLKTAVGNEMTFVLPTSNHKNFYDLFKTLEQRQEELHIASFGVSDPTLEEVFLTVCQRADRVPVNGQSKGDNPEPSEAVNIGSAPPTVPLPEERYNTGLSWKFQQFFAMLVKRFHHYRRNWRLFLSAILLPILLFAAASGMYTVRPDHTQKNLLLSPVIYGPDSYFFINDHTGGSPMMEDMLIRNPGLGTTCMDGMEKYRDEYKLECVDPATAYTVPDFTHNPNATCSCNDYKYTCDKGSPVLPPRQRVTTTGDILQNLDGRNVGNYLFESFDEFLDKRFGGYSLEHDGTINGSNKIKTTVWFNNKGFHSLPAFYNGYSNAVLRTRTETEKNGNPENYGITTFNHPFTFNTQQLSQDTILQNAADLGIAATIMLAFTFIPVGIVMYSVNEYINKEKHLQFISGIGPALYWFTSFFWDLIVLAFTTVLVFVVIVIFRHDAFWARNNAPGVIVLILLYGWATLPLVYCTTKIFSSASTAFLTIFCVLNFIGLVPICIIFILNFYQHTEIVYDAYVVCQKLFLIFPTYALGEGLIDMMTNQIKTSIFARFGTDVYVDPFTFDLLGWNYVALGIEGLVFFTMAILIDVLSNCKCESQLDVDNDRYEDDDVTNERHRLYQRGPVEDSLISRNLSKVYKRAGSRFLAVDHVTFGVSRGECFGLLGINGAGKTTTFKILTGTLNATEGSAYFSPKGLQEETAMWQNIGYCPQEEALDSFLTVREMLEFYGKMRGLDSQARKLAVRNVIENLELQPILKKTVRTCSGGMKRKLSLAISLLGDPSFVLLDEPTTGMDPVAKRLAWNCIKFAKSKGQTIVLTSHSMEECDVLCSRISILVNGQMKCLGSPQHLKNKFGDTYTIMLHVCGPLARSGKIFEFVHSYFPGASVRDHHLDVIQLDIPKEMATVSEIFRVLEKEKEHYNILYYTVSQNTLETVFLNFAREQHDTDTDGTGSSDRDSDLTTSGEEDAKLSGKLIPNTRLGYMNKAYDGFGDPISPSLKFDDPKSSKLADPDFVTIETGSGYSTNL